MPTEINKIDEARTFLRDRVLLPALAGAGFEREGEKYGPQLAPLDRTLPRIGDLVHYIGGFAGGADTDVYRGLKAASLETFEDIRPEFLDRFGARQSDRTRLDDFVVGEAYNSFDLNIFAERHDNRSGGILPIGEVGHHRAVFVKATLTGGKYPNGWIEDGALFRLEGGRAASQNSFPKPSSRLHGGRTRSGRLRCWSAMPASRPICKPLIVRSTPSMPPGANGCSRNR